MALTETDVPFLDVADPAFSIRSPQVRAARETSWYARTPYGFAVLRHEETSLLIKDRRLIQGSYAWPRHNGITGPWADWWQRMILNREGDDHARLRRLMNPAFSGRLITALVPRFQELANELIDGFYERGECEFVSEFAEPYATRVVNRLLGIPESEWPQLAEWAADLGLGLCVDVADQLPKIEAALEGYYGYADMLIADRRANPKDDFVTHLVEASEDSDRLSDEELRDNLVLLIFGGIDTTRNQLSLALDMFIRHPDQWRLLAGRPDLKSAAVEEVMRVRPTVTWVTREATEDFEFRGLQIAAGTTLHLFSESSGTDPSAVGDNPGFDIAANGRPKHFGFGGGRHYCLGHFIARGDMGEALHLLARRLPGIRHAGEPTFLPDSGNTGPLALPVAWDLRPA
ncbi:MAG: cytochrome P450 [Gaiella sp.]